MLQENDLFIGLVGYMLALLVIILVAAAVDACVDAFKTLRTWKVK